MGKHSEREKWFKKHTFEMHELYLKYREERKILFQESFWCHTIHDVSPQVTDDVVHGLAGLLIRALEIFL